MNKFIGILFFIILSPSHAQTYPPVGHPPTKQCIPSSYPSSNKCPGKNHFFDSLPIEWGTPLNETEEQASKHPLDRADLKRTSYMLNEDKAYETIKIRTEEFNSFNDGGVDSGGGSIITTIDGRIGLVDFFANAPDLFAKVENRRSIIIPESIKKNSMSHGHQIKTNSFKDIGADGELRAKIMKWKMSSPILTSYLLEGLDNLNIYFLDEFFSRVDTHYYIPYYSIEYIKEINTVAFYKKDLGLIISIPEFEALNYNDQIGLLMKELLRHIQITYHSLTNSGLQALNVQLVRGPLASGFNDGIDDPPFVSGKLAARILNERWAYKYGLNLRFDICTYFGREHELCSEKPSKSLLLKLNQKEEFSKDAGEIEKIRSFTRRLIRVINWNESNELLYRPMMESVPKNLMKK